MNVNSIINKIRLFHKSAAMNRSSLYVYPVVLLLASACANKVSPTGGDKDITPPVNTAASPPNYSIYFGAKQATISFNEFIQLKDIQKQLIVSPLMNPAPEVNVKRKSLVIKIPENLHDNTTYTLNFGEAIADIHEGNVATGFQYVFSTGPVLDSLEVNGRVFYARNLKTEKDILVMLYNDSSANDSTPYLAVPAYFAKTDSAGRFRIKNISPGTYRIFALKDGDNNYLFSRQDEPIAFQFNTVVVPDSNETTLRLFTEIPKLILNKVSQPYPGKIVLAFSAPVPFLNIVPLDRDIRQAPWDFKQVNSLKDTCILWVNDSLEDSLKLVVMNDREALDTVLFQVRNDLKKAVTGKQGKAKRLLVSSNASSGHLNPGSPLIINIGYPLGDYNLRKIILMEDSVIIRDPEYLFQDDQKMNLKLNHVFRQGKKYDILIPSGTFTSFNNYTNDTIKISFVLYEETEFGSITVNLTAPELGFDYLLLLVNEDDQIIRQSAVKPRSKTNLAFLDPGKYRLKIVYDGNGNKRWDTGRYLDKLQPERVFYYRDIITVRANWDLETDWILYN